MSLAALGMTGVLGTTAQHVTCPTNLKPTPTVEAAYESRLSRISGFIFATAQHLRSNQDVKT